jgi:hypothetical protein
MPEQVDADGDVVLDGDGEERGRIDFEVGEGGGDDAGDAMGGAVDGLVELHVGVVGGVAGELDFEVAIEGGRREGGLGQAEADLDDGELRAAGDLEHVQVAIAVAGVEGFDGAATRKSHWPAWQTPLPRAAWLAPSTSCMGCDM